MSGAGRLERRKSRWGEELLVAAHQQARSFLKAPIPPGQVRRRNK